MSAEVTPAKKYSRVVFLDAEPPRENGAAVQLSSVAAGPASVLPSKPSAAGGSARSGYGD